MCLIRLVNRLTLPSTKILRIHRNQQQRCGINSVSSRESDITATAPKWQDFATVNPWEMSSLNAHLVKNLVNGGWTTSEKTYPVLDPLNGGIFIHCSEVSNPIELDEFVRSLRMCPKHGLHNPFHNPQRYVDYGAISARVASLMRQRVVMEFFVKLIQRVAPKSHAQAFGEVSVTQKFFENFSGDQVRFLARSFSVPGDHVGQMTSGYRWPYGPVVIIAPFNFPIEIPMLQLMGALYMGNKVLLKVDSKVSVVMEQALRMLHCCGLPMNDVDFVNCDGTVMQSLVTSAQPRMTQFTGSSTVAEILCRELDGKIKIEDAGYNWKILGPDVSDVEYVVHTCDQDAYAYFGQKCSAQSVLFVHEHWNKVDILSRLKERASKRSLSDLTLGPILTVSNERFFEHLKRLLMIPGVELCFGGDLLEDHHIPDCYGSWKPTAIKIPLSAFVSSEYFRLCTTEIFGPFQIIVDYAENEMDIVLDAIGKMTHHLTAAVVSNDVSFVNKVLSSTVNGTTYHGIRARTTGAPQNHWFGPAGDPRSGGIGSPEAIKMVWSCHREVIADVGPVPLNWQPKCS